MTDDTTPDEPELAIAGDDIDELLSAELDGELDAAARDLGLTGEQARARLRATTGVDERRRALATARDLLARPPEIDDLLDARLRAKAVRAAEEIVTARTADRRERRRHLLQVVGGIAAAVVAVFAISAGMRGEHSSSKTSAAAAPAAGPTENGSGRAAHPGTPGTDLGTFADTRRAALAAVAKSVVAAAATTGKAGGEVASTTSPGAASTTVSRTANGSLDTTAAQGSASSPPPGTVSPPRDSFAATRNAARAPACTAPPGVPVAGPLVLRASAVVAGRPVVILVFSAKGKHTVVIEDQTCTLVDLQTMG